MAQITTVTSEALQAKIRQLLPSQQGFGEDLEAQNVIVPVIDLTSAAEGSSIPVSMQQAISYGSNTAVNVNNTTTTIANVAGFYFLQGIINVVYTNTGSQSVTITITDGATPKQIFTASSVGSGGAGFTTQNLQTYFFLRSGDSVRINATAFARFGGNVRQIADVNGNLINPSGFTPQ